MLVTCLHCSGDIRVPPGYDEANIVCPHCHQVVDLPKTEAPVAETTKEEGDGSWITSAIGGLVSMVVHMALIFTFALVTCNYYDGGGGEGNEVLIGKVNTQELDDTTEEELDPSESPQETAADEELEQPLDELSPDFSLPEDGVEVLTPKMAGGSSGAKLDFGGASGTAGTIGEGASFMGLRAKGRLFCIVADRSGSMAGKKLEYVKEEILETIRGLKHGQRFQVVFFNNQKTPYTKSQWLHPRRDLPEFQSWLADDISAGGGTLPHEALRHAFNLDPRPDVIFLMTDGQFQGDPFQLIASLNTGRRKVTIHTISFVDRVEEARLRKIANANGGQYRHVDF